MIKVALVSCCKTKLTHRAEAKDIYIGDLFKKIRLYVESNYDEWFVLSALLKLIEIESEVEPYEYTLIGKSKKEKQDWSATVFAQLQERFNPGNYEFYIFAGDDYRKFLIPLLETAGYNVMCH
jgi:hypothetical protein